MKSTNGPFNPFAGDNTKRLNKAAIANLPRHFAKFITSAYPCQRGIAKVLTFYNFITGQLFCSMSPFPSYGDIFTGQQRRFSSFIECGAD